MIENPSVETILRRNVRRNFTLNVLDGMSFVFGTSLISRYTVLPLLVSQLSSERWLQGLIPTITYTGWALPALFITPLIASQSRRKPFILLTTLGERLPFLFLGLLLLFASNLSASALLTIFFILYAVETFSGGFVAPAWQDFIARIIPERFWGTFFGMQMGLGGILGVAGASVVSALLGAWPFPSNFGILALLCFAAQVISYIFLSFTVEPPQKAEPRQSLGTFLSGIVPLLRRDSAFRSYLLCRSAISLGLVGHNFLTGAAIEAFHPSATEIALFTGVLLGVQALGHLGLGALADRWGHKQVLELSTGLGLVALLLAYVAPASSWFVPIFALVGASQAGFQLSGYTLAFSFSSPAERPVYIGVANTAIAPVAALGPLLAGWLAEVSSYQALFLVLLGIGLGGLLGLHWRVALPARKAQHQPIE